MNTLSALPYELVEYILKDPEVTIEDLCVVCQTCSRLRECLDTNGVLWNKKFVKRWPALTNIYRSQPLMLEHVKRDAIRNLHHRHVLSKFLTSMPRRFYYKEDLCSIDYRHIARLAGNPTATIDMSYCFIVDELRTRFTRSVEEADFTTRYYTTKVMSYVKRKHLARKWRAFCAQEDKFQTVENVALMVTEWCAINRCVSYAGVSAALDDIARLALMHLAEIHPDHIVHSVRQEQFDLWRSCNLDKNCFNSREIEQILGAIVAVVYDMMEFRPTDLRCPEENTFIDTAIRNRQCTVQLFAIILTSVARRVGVLCLITDMCDLWVPVEPGVQNPEVPDGPLEPFGLYLDIFTGALSIWDNDLNVQMSRQFIMDLLGIHVDMASSTIAGKLLENYINILTLGSIQIKSEWVPNGVRSALEFCIVINKNDTTAIMSLAEFYKSRNMFMTDIIRLLRKVEPLPHEAPDVQELINNCRRFAVTEPIVPSTIQYRTPSLKYAVGMVLSFLRTDVPEEAVVIGWDLRHNWLRGDKYVVIRSYNPEEPIDQPYPLTDEECVIYTKPFYKMLTSHGYIYYVAEELLVPTPAVLITEHVIGQYFQTFNGRYYMPNRQLQRIYAEDTDVLREALTFQLNQQ